MRSVLWILLLIPHFFFCQLYNANWHFGLNCGITFTSGAPVQVASAIIANEGSSSISDVNGKLLFYTNGLSIWNSSHQVMPNGSGLLGHLSSTQSSLIVRRPGSTNRFFVFTTDQVCGSNGFRYSEVDMSLSGGTGSVTSKNVTIISASVTERMAAARHCNGEDAWIVVHDCESNVFRSYSVTIAGVSSVAVTSSIGPVMGYAGGGGFAGEMKVSPDGKRVGLVYSDGQGSTYHLFDFDAKSGAITNWLKLGYASQGFSYGCTFSPASNRFFVTQHDSIVQWDLCAGSPQLILTSRQSYRVTQQAGTSSHWPRAMQIGTDGNIYVSLQTSSNVTVQALGIINNPNSAQGFGNYTHLGVSLNTGTLSWGLPNFINDLTKTKTASISHTVNCGKVLFNWQPTANCAMSSSVTSVSWNFGEPASGPANTSSFNSPIHDFSSSGTFTVQLNVTYDCGKDSILTQMVIPAGVPALTITAPAKACSGDLIKLSASGADTYSWSTGAQTKSVSVTVGSQTLFSVAGTNTVSGCTSNKSFSVLVSPCTFLESQRQNEIARIYPNPVSDFLTLEGFENQTVKIINLLGRTVLTLQIKEITEQLDVTILAKGIYLLETSKGGRRKFVKD